MRTALLIISLFLLLSCDERTNRILPAKVPESANMANRIIPLEHGNVWYYHTYSDSIPDYDPTMYNNRAEGIGDSEWFMWKDTSLVRIGIFPTVKMIKNNVFAGEAYSFGPANSIYKGHFNFDSSRYVIDFEISDFPPIGYETYDFILREITTVNVPLGRAYDCYVYEGQNKRYYFHRGTGLVMLDSISEERNVIMRTELTWIEFK